MTLALDAAARPGGGADDDLPSERALLTAILDELRQLNANMGRLEDDVRAALPFRFRPRK